MLIELSESYVQTSKSRFAPSSADGPRDHGTENKHVHTPHQRLSVPGVTTCRAHSNPRPGGISCGSMGGQFRHSDLLGLLTVCLCSDSISGPAPHRLPVQWLDELICTSPPACAVTRMTGPATHSLPVQWLWWQALHSQSDWTSTWMSGLAPHRLSVQWLRWPARHPTVCLCSNLDDRPCTTQSACAVTWMTVPAPHCLPVQCLGRPGSHLTVRVYLRCDMDDRPIRITK